MDRITKMVLVFTLMVWTVVCVGVVAVYIQPRPDTLQQWCERNNGLYLAGSIWSVEDCRFAREMMPCIK